jgi:phage terminase small subunit
VKKRSKKKAPKNKKKAKQINEKAEKKGILFAEEYLANGRNGTRAYLKVYPHVTEGTARATAPKLLAKSSVKDYLDKREAEMLSDLNITTRRVLLEASRLAFFDVRKLYDDDGNLKAPQDLDDDTAAALASVDTEELFEGKGEGRSHVGTIKKVKVFDKNAAVERLMKYLGHFKDKEATPPLPHPVTVTVDVHLTPEEAYKQICDGAAKR